MAKQWFTYECTATTFSAQITPSNYKAVGTFPGHHCTLADRVYWIYSFYTSGTPAVPSDKPGGNPSISSNLQIYIAAFTINGQAVEAQPLSGKKYVYVQGS